MMKRNFIQRIENKIELKNYIIRPNEVVVELSDAVYKLDLNNLVVNHVSGRYSQLIHENLIKEV
jgi:hypothetical protein